MERIELFHPFFFPFLFLAPPVRGGGGRYASGAQLHPSNRLADHPHPALTPSVRRAFNGNARRVPAVCACPASSAAADSRGWLSPAHRRAAAKAKFGRSCAGGHPHAQRKKSEDSLTHSFAFIPFAGCCSLPRPHIHREVSPIAKIFGFWCISGSGTTAPEGSHRFKSLFLCRFCCATVTAAHSKVRHPPALSHNQSVLNLRNNVETDGVQWCQKQKAISLSDI